jgi:hypothetical protein
MLPEELIQESKIDSRVDCSTDRTITTAEAKAIWLEANLQNCHFVEPIKRSSLANSPETVGRFLRESKTDSKNCSNRT